MPPPTHTLQHGVHTYRFNEPLELPEMLRPTYRSMLDEENSRRAAASRELLKEWGR
jgi:hypothetical protein